MKLEVCIDCVESARAAREGGANRLEVCGAIGVGGITPSRALIEQCLELGGIEIAVMIRPHAGRFCYSADDVTTMMRDIRLAKQLGVQGVVIGALLPDGRIDRRRCQQMLDAARPLAVTFHRAFDLTRYPMVALDELLDLGFDRLLTAGQAATAIEGSAMIRRLIERAGDRMAVMAGGGVNAAELAALVCATGVREIHASASEIEPAGDGSMSASFCGPRKISRAEKVRALVQAMQACEAS